MAPSDDAGERDTPISPSPDQSKTTVNRKPLDKAQSVYTFHIHNHAYPDLVVTSTCSPPKLGAVPLVVAHDADLDQQVFTYDDLPNRMYIRNMKSGLYAWAPKIISDTVTRVLEDTRPRKFNFEWSFDGKRCQIVIDGTDHCLAILDDDGQNFNPLVLVNKNNASLKTSWWTPMPYLG